MSENFRDISPICPIVCLAFFFLLEKENNRSPLVYPPLELQHLDQSRSFTMDCPVELNIWSSFPASRTRRIKPRSHVHGEFELGKLESPIWKDDLREWF
ncbi:uncharacterized protein BO66DRAFT_389486 [Aspergillus aculeatinus CBS 121060]|uniref:Uncharacterized protein n=1 Tax=Aspergillus aculeatinus CBS 121060 TaxID=1448322 RepID=A0ACD1HGX1_9EURO|nr:hypothetical protein BO66DRAFT_389486 [Aspergillus aculeatinus CBS 121060]RAH72907.1 hypothetical protein BO66DRAFT_389486 [Aspergillus aculeatinus CBS 121060]